MIADYSQIELRILADFSEDKNFINAFVSGQDFHAATAAQIFGIKAGGRDARSAFVCKAFEFWRRLRHRRVAVRDDDRPVTDRMPRTRCGDISRPIRRWTSGCACSRKDVLTERPARTASGRMARIKFVDDDRSSIGAAQRYAKNMPIQGTSADILKRALRLLHDDIRDTSRPARQHRPRRDRRRMRRRRRRRDRPQSSNPPCSVPASNSSNASPSKSTPPSPTSGVSDSSFLYFNLDILRLFSRYFAGSKNKV